MKVAITGATGLLGTALTYALDGKHDVLMISDASEVAFGKKAKRAIADVRDKKVLSQVLSKFEPDVIVNCAALTNVDYCEDHYEEALELSAGGAQNSAEYADENDCRLIHISTDYVFDGLKGGGMYIEEDEPNPVSKYGESKLEAEKRIEEIDCDYLILRTTMYGWNVRGKKNYAMSFHAALAAGKPAKAFVNQYNTPLLANDLADAIVQLLGKDASGVLHVGGGTRANRAGFARELASVFGFDPRLVEEVKLTEGMLAARRPPDASLDSSKLEAILGRRMPTLKAGLKRFRLLAEEGYAGKFKVIRG